MNIEKISKSTAEVYKDALNPELIEALGIEEKDVPHILKDIERYFNTNLSYLQSLGMEITPEMLFSHFGDITNNISDIIRDHWRYYNYRKDIEKTYKKNEDWGEVFAEEVYSDVKEAQETFIDYVEEVYNTEVKDVKHLQELTNITHLSSYYHKGKQIEIKEEAQKKEQAIKELEETLHSARYSKYFKTLEMALRNGATYKVLLQIKPQDFGLPKTWSGCLGSDQYSSTLWALGFEFMINEPASLMLLPDLRSIALEIEAPYSVLMDCYNLTNKGKKYGATGN